MLLKTIIQGRLEFGNQKSYEKVTKMFLQRIETYYKTDVLFKFEDIFKEDEFALEIPRYVHHITDKAFRVTTSLLGYCAQFAVAGSVRAWLIREGEVIAFETLEPDSDKGAVQSFVKGRKLVKVKGKEEEAIQALSLAIEKFDRNAQAYERRAKVNFLMKNYHDALRDYKKCITIDPNIPTAYYGIAKIHMIREEYDEAIKNLEEALKKSIALQTLYWKSRKLKAECHMIKKEWDKAAFDLKLYTNRKFDSQDPNSYWQRWAHYMYGVILMEQELFADALQSLEKAAAFTEINDGIKESDIIAQRGIAKLKTGKSGYVKDIKDAASKGSKKAKNILKSIS